MDDALVVRFLERLGDLNRDVDDLVDGDRPSREAFLQVFALDELEREERRAVGLLEAVNGGDVRMVECGQQVRLATEARQPLGVPRHFGRQHLDGDLASERRVGGAIDLAHATRANGRRHAVVRQGLPDDARHRILLTPRGVSSPRRRRAGRPS